MKGLLGTFFVACGIITYRAIARKIVVPTTAPLKLPLPSEYTAAALIWAALALAPSAIAPIPALVGVGLDIAMVFDLWPSAAAAPSVPAPLQAPVKRK